MDAAELHSMYEQTHYTVQADKGTDLEELSDKVLSLPGIDAIAQDGRTLIFFRKSEQLDDLLSLEGVAGVEETPKPYVFTLSIPSAAVKLRRIACTDDHIYFVDTKAREKEPELVDNAYDIHRALRPFDKSVPDIAYLAPETLKHYDEREPRLQFVLELTRAQVRKGVQELEHTDIYGPGFTLAIPPIIREIAYYPLAELTFETVPGDKSITKPFKDMAMKKDWWQRSPLKREQWKLRRRGIFRPTYHVEGTKLDTIQEVIRFAARLHGRMDIMTQVKFTPLGKAKKEYPKQ